MPFIDWSDPEGMFDLLIEFVADERSSARDAKHRQLLSKLLTDLSALQMIFMALSPSERVASLREIRASLDGELENDPSVEHLEACVNELERISG
jgi:hypothetical protein